MQLIDSAENILLRLLNWTQPLFYLLNKIWSIFQLPDHVCSLIYLTDLGDCIMPLAWRQILFHGCKKKLFVQGFSRSSCSCIVCPINGPVPIPWQETILIQFQSSYLSRNNPIPLT